MADRPQTTAVRRPKRATVYCCNEPQCQTGTDWYDFACDKHWVQLTPQTQTDLIETAAIPGTTKRISIVHDALDEWAAIRAQEQAA